MAEKPSKYDLSALIVDMNGNPLTRPLLERMLIDADELSAARACAIALFTPPEKPKQLTGDESATRYELGMRLLAAKDGMIEMTDRETVRIRDALSPAFPPLIVGQVYRALDGKAAAG